MQISWANILLSYTSQYNIHVGYELSIIMNVLYNLQKVNWLFVYM